MQQTWLGMRWRVRRAAMRGYEVGLAALFGAMLMTCWADAPPAASAPEPAPHCGNIQSSTAVMIR